MANAGTLEVVITATTSGLTAGIANARDALNKAGPDLKRYGAILAGTVVAGLTASIYAFGNAQKSATMLSQALKNQGVNSRAALEELIRLSSALQHLSGFSDEAIQGASAIIVKFGATGNELKRLTKAAVDAAASGHDLEGSAEALGKAFIGETGRLKQYGITIDENIPKALRFKAALDQWEQKFGGAAAAKGKTFFGMVAIAKEDVSDFAEAIGRNLVPVVQRFVKFMIDNRTILMKAADDVGRSIVKWTDDFMNVINWMRANKSIIKDTLFAAGLGALAGTPGGPAGMIGGAIIGAAVGTFVGTHQPGKPGFVQPATRVSTQPASLVPAGMSAGTDDKDKVKKETSDFSNLWTQAFNEVLNTGKIIFDGIKDLMSGTISVLSTAFQQTFIQLAEGGRNFTDIMRNLGLGFRNLMFKVISDILAKQITAIIMGTTAEKAAALMKIAYHKAVAFAGAMAAHSGIPFVGIAIGLAAAAAIAALISGAIAFADGGIVNRPTLGLVGEAGPEAIIPLSKGKEMGILGGGGAGGGGATEVHLHFDGATFVDADETKWDNLVRRFIIPALAAYQDKTRANDFRRWSTRTA